MEKLTRGNERRTCGRGSGGMKQLCSCAITILIICFVQLSWAEVVLLTDDKTTVLDLTSKEGAAVDLFECGLYVQEEGGNSYLVHSKGKLPIPKSAVHVWPNGVLAEVETKGTLLGLKLVSMLLVNHKSTDKPPVPYRFKGDPSNANREIDRKKPAEEWIFADRTMTFFFAEKESTITKTLKAKFPKTRLIPTSELGHEHQMILLNPMYLHPVGGFPASENLFSEHLRKQELISIDYNCGVKQDLHRNPYFKKQDEVFRFGQ